MYFKVKITKGLPQAKSGGFTGNNLNKQVISFGGADMNAASKHLENTRYLKEVPREEANLEAEKGESAFGDINGDGFPEHMLIGGKRHSNGGTPLNLPDGTFIFSDTASMRIKDPKILAKFGKKTGSFTPAELAKPYDLNKYRKILEDPNSDAIEKKSAELMIKNINMKLGALALAQESKKGFPQGIPEVARPYMEQMGIKEEDLIPQKAQPEAQVNNQAMNNPYENQGMGEQAPQEESMEAPMGRYGFQMGRRLRVAQEGMEQGQPSPEEMAMMQQQQQQQGAPQQQGGADPLAQMVQQVQQMLQQGAQPEDVIMQLLQNQVSPQAIMQILVQIGMPQEEAQAAIQQVMQQVMQQGQQQNPQEEMAEGPQGQNPQEEMMEAPMAQYGMTMGGYDMPFYTMPLAQNGFTVTEKNGELVKPNPNYVPPYVPQVIDTSKYDSMNSLEKWRLMQDMKNYPDSYSDEQKNKFGPQEMTQDVFDRMTKYDDKPPFEVPKNRDGGMHMAQFGMTMGGYDMPFHDTQYRDGGSLNRFQGGGVKYDIPKDAIVINRGDYDTDEDYAKARDLEFAKAGSKPVYILMPDGKYKKVSQRTVGPDPYTGQDLGTTWNNAKEYAATFREMEKSINTPEFTRLLANYTRAALKDETKYKNSNLKTSKAYATYKDKKYSDEEIRNAFILHQKRNTALQAHGIQARYFENASTGRLLTPEQMVAKKVISDKTGQPITLADAQAQYKIYKDANITDLGKAFDKVEIKLGDTALEQATFQGFTDALNNKANLTPEEQKALENWGAYESGMADEKGQKNPRISPIDYVYTDTTGEQKGAYNPTKNELYETDVEGTPIEDVKVDDVEEPYVAPPAQPWAQDRLNRLNAGIDYFSVKNRGPWAANYHPEMLTPTFYDPTRELAAQSEQANIANQALGQFTGAQDLSARSASIQGQGAKQAADTLGRYNNLNVGIANQFAGNNVQIGNEAQRFNQAQNKQLFDQRTIANQQYDNAKRSLRHNLVDSENTLLTNMWKTDAMNQMYPQYAIDPSVGGRMHFTQGKEQDPTLTQNTLDYAQKISRSNLPEKVQQSLINDYIKRYNGVATGEKPNMYGKKGGTTQMAYVMGSNVFPFMFT